MFLYLILYQVRVRGHPQDEAEHVTKVVHKVRIFKRASLLGEAFINRAFDRGKRKEGWEI